MGAGYGQLTDETAAVLQLAARTEAIVLDPVYSGRAMAGLVASVEDGTIAPGQTAVFWHAGGLPGLFALFAVLWLLVLGARPPCWSPGGCEEG